MQNADKYIGSKTKTQTPRLYFSNKHPTLHILKGSGKWNGDMYFSHGTGASKDVIISLK